MTVNTTENPTINLCFWVYLPFCLFLQSPIVIKPKNDTSVADSFTEYTDLDMNSELREVK